MNKVYIHSKNTIDKYVLKYIYGLIPLVLYGIYKNGLILYNANLINFFSIFKVLYLIIISLIIYIIFSIITKRKLKLNLELLTILIIPLFMPYSINLIIYSISLFVLLFIDHYLSKILKYNNISFIILGIILVLVIFNSYNYLNPIEQTHNYSYSFLDLLFGRIAGGIATSSIIIGIILIIYYSIFTIYKQNIAISSIIVFLLLTAILNNFNINSLLNSNAILSFILIAPELKNTPVSLKGTIIYGCVVGIISALLCQFVSIYTGVFMAIFIVSLSYSILRKFDKNKHL